LRAGDYKNVRGNIYRKFFRNTCFISICTKNQKYGFTFTVLRKFYENLKLQNLTKCRFADLLKSDSLMKNISSGILGIYVILKLGDIHIISNSRKMNDQQSLSKGMFYPLKNSNTTYHELHTILLRNYRKIHCKSSSKYYFGFEHNFHQSYKH